MGDEMNQLRKPIPEAIQTMVVDTLGGRIQVSWDKESAATPFGQLVFFAEFLEVSGLFDAWVEEYPVLIGLSHTPTRCGWSRFSWRRSRRIWAR